MVIEIVDFPMKNDDSPLVMLAYQRVIWIFYIEFATLFGMGKGPFWSPLRVQHHER